MELILFWSCFGLALVGQLALAAQIALLTKRMDLHEESHRQAKIANLGKKL